MDSNKYSTQVERLGVVETGRRRRWTDDEKLKIVLEGMQTPRAISSTVAEICHQFGGSASEISCASLASAKTSSRITRIVT